MTVPGAIIYLKQNSVSVLQYDDKQWSEIVDQHHHSSGKLEKFIQNVTDKKLHLHHYEISFPGASAIVNPVGEQASSCHYNYFIGNDENKFASNVKDFSSVRYPEIYPGIDLLIYATGYGLKYDFILSPGADLSLIKVLYNHVDQIRSESDTTVLIKTSLGEFREILPHSYQYINGSIFNVACQFLLNKDTLSLGCKEFSPQHTLTIDPQVVFATYAGNTADNFGYTATYDDDGHLFSGGICTSPDFSFNKNGRYPATTGAFDETYNGGGVYGEYFFSCDITLSKYSPDGSTLLYATYLGGSHNEYPQSIIVDHTGELVVFGTTFSTNYPTTANAFQRNINGKSDIIITRFSPDGSSLVGSTYVGGSEMDGLNEDGVLNFFYADNFRGEVILDSNSNVYAVSTTFSTDFPVVNAFQNTLSGGSDGVILRFNPDLSSLKWSSYLGGRLSDALYSIDIDTSGKIFVSGGTRSDDLPKSTGKIGTTYKGGISDGFIAKVDPFTNSLIKTAYWGSNSYEQIYSLEIDNDNSVYVVGQNLEKMPVVGTVYENPNSGQFLSKFDDELDNVIWSTVFGTGDGKPDITINAFLVDECGRLFISGWGGKTSNYSFSNTNKLPITSDAYQKTTDGSDFYLMVLSRNAKALAYATYFGGSKTHDHVDGGTSRFDKKGVIYQSVCASCPDIGQHAISDFPTTPGAFAEKNISPRCSNASFKIAFGNLNRPPQLSSKLLHVRVLDTLNHTYVIHDPDEDSIFVTMTTDQKMIGRFSGFNSYSTGETNWSQRISFSPICGDEGDTIRVNFYAVDKGCPEIKDSQSYIDIVVDPAPVIDPPEYVCLNFAENDAIRLTWDAIQESKYFDKITLYRIDPSGNVKILTTTTAYAGGSFTDLDVIAPKKNNYIYYMIVTNVCGVDGPSSYKISTTKEFIFPIKVSYVTTATVTDENEVEVYWAHSDEEDFGSYDIYKKKNNLQDSFEYVTSTYNRHDTSFTDKKVQVNKQSYCYAIVVTDNCGHVSQRSNKGCTIVLDGISTPFKHHVFWNEYEVWDAGVERYTLSRSVDTGSLRPIVSTEFNITTFNDTSFDYNWGGYWYRVTAYENAGDYNAESQSNKIYLIQPPLLHVPNAFTANGDGLNELWGIVPVFVKEYHVQVYDRWGSKVYDSQDKLTDWDGFIRGVQTANSVYVYAIRYTGWDGSVHYRKGTVTILR